MNLQLSRSSDYAIRLMVYLAAADSPPVPRSEIADAQAIPEAYLQKLLPVLVRAGLVSGRRGPRGGFQLARPARRVSLLEVIEAVDGPLALNICVDSGTGCPLSGRCAVHRIWCIANRQLVALREETTVAQLACEAHAPA